jgi:hypothetical protein
MGAAIAATAAPGRVDSDGGFVDVDLPIVRYHINGSNSLELVASGLIEGHEVGFEMQFDSQQESTFGGAGFIRSIGPDSDAFVAMLAHQYGMQEKALKMAPQVPMTVFVLTDDSGETNNQPIKLKIFFNVDGESDYGEAFMKVDIQNKTLEFRDKDPEYHGGILASLRKGG